MCRDDFADRDDGAGRFRATALADGREGRAAAAIFRAVGALARFAGAAVLRAGRAGLVTLRAFGFGFGLAFAFARLLPRLTTLRAGFLVVAFLPRARALPDPALRCFTRAMESSSPLTLAIPLTGDRGASRGSYHRGRRAATHGSHRPRSKKPLERRHRRKGFASGEERVDDWLIHKAIAAMEKNTSTTRALVHDDGAIVGYYTLATTALDVSLVPLALLGGKRPTRAPPTLTLAWLGVDTRYRGQGFGTRLFVRALADSVQVHRLVRFVAVIIDALTDDNLLFYEQRGFLRVPGTTNKLYLPAATLLEVVRASH